jgi:hypothetical protein
MKHRRMLTRLKALSLLAPEAVILTPVADSDVLVAHKNGTDTDALGQFRKRHGPEDDSHLLYAAAQQFSQSLPVLVCDINT